MTFCFRINYLFFTSILVKRAVFQTAPFTKNAIIVALALIAISLPVHSEAKPWSERKFNKAVLNIDKDIQRKRWKKSIKRSKTALPQCITLYSESSPSCILILKNINQSYEKLHAFNPDPEQIEQAYTLSYTLLGTSHPTTNSARDYYYKYLIFKESYIAAIPLLLEIIELEKSRDNDEYQLMERYNQLYALEGLTENWPAEEAALIIVVRLAEQVLGKQSDEFKAAVKALAYNYCTQKKYYEYFELIKQQQQEVSCFSGPRN